jgi:hypothetical protein
MALTLDGTNGIVSSGSITTQSATGVIFSDSSSLPAASSPYVLKNRIINGAMVIDQRNAGASVTPTSNQYTLDRWQASLSQTGKFSVQQNAAAVTPPVGFTNYLGVTSLSSYAVLAGDLFIIRQHIEGYNTSDLAWGTANAKTVTLSFWVRSSLTGTFGGVLQEGNGATRSYPFSYTISVANTWELKSITIAGDTSGTWQTTNNASIDVTFGLGVGSTYSGAAGAWGATMYFSATGATSVVGTNGATFYITGVQLEIGTTATPFERRLYGQELANCQRYYWEMARGSLSANGAYSWMGEGGFYSTSQYNLPVMFPVTMRTSPSLNVSNTSAYFGLDTPGSITFATFSIFQPSIYGTLIYAAGLTGGTAGYACSTFTRNASAFCAFSAEL